jgi:putative ABC transport system permease protein
MPFLKLFYRLILRPLRHDPVRTSLTVIAIALGVAAVLAIQLAGDAAAGSFRSSMETLTGRSALEVTATGGLAPEIFARLAALPYPLKIHPRIEDYAVISGRSRTVALLGIDLLGESLSSDSSFASSDDSAFQQDDSIWAGRGLGFHVGDRLTLAINDRSASFIVRGVLGDESDEVLVIDLSQATRILRPTGRLDRILLEVPASRSAQEWESVIRAALPDGLTVTREGAQTDENQRMLAAFRWNLSVLSYVSLAVGAFLIYNTISVSVVRRRFEIGILRAVGATRAVIMTAFLGEAAAVGLLGAIAGVGLGRLMAEGAVKLVSATVDSLYVSSRPGTLALTWPVALLAIAIGVGVSALSALSPAWEASLVTPVEAMARGRREHQARVHQGRDLIFAAILAGAAWLASRQQPVAGRPIFGYLAAVLLIASSALAIPALVSTLSKATAALVRRLFGVEALLATRSLAGSLRRTSVLVAALSTAIAVLVAIGIMVGSFRETVLLWMTDQLRADLYLSPAVPAAADRHPKMSAGIIERLARLPGVAAVDQLRSYEISYQAMPATLAGVDVQVASRYQTRSFLSGASAPAVFRQLANSHNVIVSEPFANKHHVRAGDTLTLALGGKQAAFHVIDVYYDYSSERGSIFLDRATLLQYLPDPDPSNLAVYLNPGVSPDEAKKMIQAAVADRHVVVFLNRSLREQGMRIFDRTFAITYALEAVAVFVAVMGVGGALLALVIDRRREFGLLRFLGAADAQVRRMILFEAGFLGLLANLAGMILGYLLSLLLIYVIDKQSFGWTIQFHWPVVVLLPALGLVYLATLLAGLYPARIATQLVPIEVIHEE